MLRFKFTNFDLAVRDTLQNLMLIFSQYKINKLL